ncbi:MAG: cystine transporter subunit [Methanoregula sp. PtaU1.Bin051]|nr:MAG: cystine transporter subunit [Methanoregula sp. PtaU1.Bin051]
MPSVIRVVTDNNYPPYTFLDSSGNIQGISVDQWKLYSQKTGIPVEITGLPWNEAQARLLAGDFDVIDTMGYTEERAKLYDFLPSYSRVDVPIFFSKEIPGISGPDSLSGFVVAVQSGDSVIPVLESHNVTSLKEYASYEDIIRDAKAGTIYVFCMDRPSALFFMHKYGIAADYKETAPLYSTEVHRAVRKGSPLFTVLSDGFGRITPSEYRAIEDKWLGTSLFDPAILHFVVIVLIVILVLLLGLAAWNFALRRSVAVHTRELHEELSRRRLAEEELARANRTLQLFGRLLQEEIKTSLFALRGHLALITQDPNDTEGQKSLESSRQITASIEELVDSVKYLKDIGNRKQEWIDITQAFTYARSHHQVLGITFEAHTRGIEVFAEPVFESILSILISDSLQFGKTVDRIALSCRRSGNAIVLVYEDNGTGILVSDKERVFIRPEDGGTGHRLAVVKEILSMLGMEITESGEPGHGVRFEIMVPEGKYRIINPH